MPSHAATAGKKKAAAAAKPKAPAAASAKPPALGPTATVNSAAIAAPDPAAAAAAAAAIEAANREAAQRSLTAARAKEPTLVELEPEREQMHVHGQLAQVLAWEQEQEQASALETMAAPLRRASACLGHRPLEAQRPGDDQTPRHRPDQRPRTHT